MKLLHLCITRAVLAAALLVPVLALAQDLSPDSGTEALVSAIFTAIREGKPGLAVVIALMLVIAIVRKSVAPKVGFLQGDLGGTLLAFGTVVLIMLAGPLSAGVGLSMGLVQTAVLTAWATSGGFTWLKRTVLAPLLPKLAPKLYELVGAVPVVGWLLKLVVKVAVGKYLAAPASAAPKPAAAPEPVAAPVPLAGSNLATGGLADASDGKG